MMRLTVHVENAPFVERERKVVKDTIVKGKTVPLEYKPKKSKCIINTFSFNDLRTQKEVNEKLSYLRSKHKVAKWTEGAKKGKEMVYVSWQ
tara:strand:+ start:566 stop:838 length:273 start_codon:yes stop_codon:yes gene_type:complete